jgi:teichuronic acid exporter
MEVSEATDKAKSGAQYLILRSVFSVVLRSISLIWLVKLISHEDFGLNLILGQILGLGVYLSDLGLVQVLLIQKREPTKNEATTAFYLQQVISLVFIFITLVFSPLIVSINHMPSTAYWMIALYSVSILLSSFRIMPLFYLERSLRFQAIGKYDFLETILQISLVLLFAYLGWGIWALLVSNICARVFSLIGLWRMSPWRSKGLFDRVIAIDMLRRGFPIFSMVLLPVLIDSIIVTPLVSHRLSLHFLGLLSRALVIIAIPEAITAALVRITVPYLSQLQGQDGQYGVIAEQNLAMCRRINALYSIIIPTAVFFAPFLLPIVLDPNKWGEVVPLFQIGVMEVIPKGLFALVALASVVGGRPQDRIKVILVFGTLRALSTAFLLYYGNLQYGFLIGWYVTTLGEFLYTVYLAHKHLKQGRGLILELCVPVFLVLFTTLGCTGILYKLVASSGQIHVGVVSMLVTALYFIVIFVLDHFFSRGILLQESRLLVGMVLSRFQKAKAPATVPEGV